MRRNPVPVTAADRDGRRSACADNHLLDDRGRRHGAFALSGSGVRHDGWNGPRLRRHAQADGAHLRHASAPAGAEHRPGLEVLQEREPFVVDRRDERFRIALGDRSQYLVVDQAGIVRQTENPAQHLAAAAGAGIHAVIEDAVIDASRELVAALRIPVLGAIDRIRIADLHRADVGGRRIGLPVAPIVGERDTEVGRAARIGWMVDVAAFVREQATQSFVVSGRRHSRSSRNEKSRPEAAALVVSVTGSLATGRTNLQHRRAPARRCRQVSAEGRSRPSPGT